MTDSSYVTQLKYNNDKTTNELWRSDVQRTPYDKIYKILLEMSLFDDVINICMEFYGINAVVSDSFIGAITASWSGDDEDGICHNLYEERLLYSSYIGDRMFVEFILVHHSHDILPLFQERSVVLALHSGYVDMSKYLLACFNCHGGNMFTNHLNIEEGETDTESLSIINI